MDASKIKITRASRKSLSLQVLSDGTIEIRAPKLMPKFFINRFIQKNSDWIEKRLSVAKQNAPKVRKFTNGEKFIYLGKEYSLQIGNYTSIKIYEDKLLLPAGLLFRAKKELENWYIKQAKEVIIHHLNQYAKEMNTSFVSVSFSDTKSKWGSCTHDNRLQFNYRLIMAPLLVLRYVVIHELAHTLEKNHARSFWSKVSRFNPSYKEQIKWLKKNGDSLRL